MFPTDRAPTAPLELPALRTSATTRCRLVFVHLDIAYLTTKRQEQYGEITEDSSVPVAFVPDRSN